MLARLRQGAYLQGDGAGTKKHPAGIGSRGAVENHRRGSKKEYSLLLKPRGYTEFCTELHCFLTPCHSVVKSSVVKS